MRIFGDLWFGQQFDPADAATIGLLVVLEGLLSIDNALVLGLLAKRLPKEQQKRALTYGLIGAFVFRLTAIVFAAMLLKWHLAKLLGGAYLVYVAGKYFFFEARNKVDEKFTTGPEGEPILLNDETGRPLSDAEVEEEIKARIPLHMPGFEPELATESAPTPISAHSAATSTPAPPKKYPGFWSTVAVIELTDIAFAIDSILAAMALVGPPPNPAQTHPKLWVVVTGGMLGVILMRFAAVLFIKMLERFPRFETTAYLLVFVIGAKLIADYWFNVPGQPPRLDFHHPGSPAFWTFWIVMLVCFSFGFVPKRRRPATAERQKT